MHSFVTLLFMPWACKQPSASSCSRTTELSPALLVFLDLQQVMPEPDTATVWIMRDGSILSAGPVFTDWFAYASKVGSCKLC
jgi:hypothetical protein